MVSCLKMAASVCGLCQLDNSEFLIHALNEFQKQLEDRNNCSQPKLLRAIFGNPHPIAYPITMEITEQTENMARGIFVVFNSITEARDEIDFQASIGVDEDFDGKAVVVHMPHWQFFYYMTDSARRMELEAFLEAEAKERTGIDASLRLSGLE